MEKSTILIVENDESQYQSIKEILIFQGYKIIQSPNRKEALRILGTLSPDIVILGPMGNSSSNALETAQEIRKRDKKVPLILIAKNSCEELAIRALRAGISDYISAPFSGADLVESVGRCLMLIAIPPSRLFANNRTAASLHNEHCSIIGESPAMQTIKEYTLKVAATDSTVLITGETGTGKELVAEAIHYNSLRCKKPFVCINCSALPDSLLESELFGYERGAFTGAVAGQPGKFELADEGTIFLDEIGEMNLCAQAKILRTIENKKIYRLGGNRPLSLDVRIIAATNQAPERLKSEEKFRKDLYFRLNMARIDLPPLRERKEDIPHLLNHFLEELNQRFKRSVERFSEETLDHLLRYDWPGNVRELKNLCEAIFINQPTRMISLHDLPTSFQRLLRDSENLSQSECDQLLSALLSTKWNVSQAARKLHWSRMTIYRKIEKYHIKKTCMADGILT